MDRGFFARSTDADLVMNTMLIQKLHSVAETRQLSHEAQSFMRSIVRWKILTRMAWAECCSKEVLSLTPRHSLAHIGSDEVKG